MSARGLFPRSGAIALNVAEPQNIRTGNKELACQILAFFADNPGDAINFGVILHEDTPYLTRLQPQHFRTRELG